MMGLSLEEAAVGSLLAMRRCFWCTVKKKKQGLSLTAVDICPERMDAADAEAPGPPRIETAVEF